MIDVLARRYRSLDFMASWDFDEAIDFIFFAIQQEAEDKIEQRWIIHYQDQKTYP